MNCKDPINISEEYERVNIEWSQARRDFLKVQVRFQVLESLTLLNEFPPGNVDINSTLCLGSSINDITVLGGQWFCDVSTKAFVIKSVTMGGGGCASKIVQNWVTSLMDDPLCEALKQSIKNKNPCYFSELRRRPDVLARLTEELVGAPTRSSKLKLDQTTIGILNSHIKKIILVKKTFLRLLTR